MDRAYLKTPPPAAVLEAGKLAPIQDEDKCHSVLHMAESAADKSAHRRRGRQDSHPAEKSGMPGISEGGSVQNDLPIL
jgi:hypothetical protein